MGGNSMSGYKCAFCGKVSGTTKDAVTKKEKPAMSDRGCTGSSSGKHKWVKK